jgi:hypothetical protein
MQPAGHRLDYVPWLAAGWETVTLVYAAIQDLLGGGETV